MTEIPTNRADYSQWKVDEETGELIQVHDALGREIPDPIPMAPPLGYTQPISMFDQMRAQIRQEHMRLQQMALEELAETAEQANDFEVDEDLENQPSLYEEKFDPVDFEVRQRLRNREFRAEVEKREKALNPEPELLDASNHDKGTEISPQRSTRGSDRNSEPRGGKDKKTGVSGSVPKGSDGDQDDD